MSAVKLAEGLVFGALATVLCLDACIKNAEHKENKENIIIDAENETLTIKCKTNDIPYEDLRVYTRIENRKLYLYVKGAAVSEDMVIKTVLHKYRIKHIAVAEFKGLSWNMDDDHKLRIVVPIAGYADKISVKKIKAEGR